MVTSWNNDLSDYKEELPEEAFYDDDSLRDEPTEDETNKPE